MFLPVCSEMNLLLHAHIAPPHLKRVLAFTSGYVGTVKLLETVTPDFIEPNMWPANSPDLNPVDYQIWGTLQEKVYNTRVTDIDCLKQRLLHEWNKFDQQIIDNAVIEWRKRLRACVNAQGGHFEFKL